MVMCVKYRKQLLSKGMRTEKLKEILGELGEKYWFEMDEIGTDGDHVHVFVGAAPRYAPSQILQIIKSLTAREMFSAFPEMKKQLWGWEFWSDGGYIGTVGDEGNEITVRKYIKEQGDHKEKEQAHQLALFKV